jgi:hypothetical protein
MRTSCNTGRFIVIACAVLAFAGCRDDSVFEADKNQTIINEPPELYSVYPADSSPELAVGESVVFRVHATDPDGDALRFAFTVNDSVVGGDSVYTYIAAEKGVSRVRIKISDGLTAIYYHWLLTVTNTPDLIAPAQVNIVTVGPGPDPHQLEIRWRAVGDDGMSGRADEYIIATRNFPIVDELDWTDASYHPVDGSLTDPGTEMAQMLDLVCAAQYTAVVVRGQDECGNLSPLGPHAEGITRGYTNSGIVYDVFTGEPVEGAVIRSGSITTTTGPDGRWQLDELPASATGPVISDDGVFEVVGDYFDYKIFDFGQNNAFFQAYLLPVFELESGHFTDFLHFVSGFTERNGVPHPSYLRHWELPVDLYVRPFERDGLDYKATIEEVATGLSAELGFTPFHIVDSPTELGVECFFVEDLYRDNYGTKQFTEDWYPVWGRIEFRMVYTVPYEEAFRRVIKHELGHVLGLGHSTDDRHLMVGGIGAPQVNAFHADEIAVLHLIYGMPRGVSDGVFIRE